MVAGFDIVFAADVDPDAVETHRRNFDPGAARIADLTRLAPEEIPDADVWLAGPPCQWGWMRDLYLMSRTAYGSAPSHDK